VPAALESISREPPSGDAFSHAGMRRRGGVARDGEAVCRDDHAADRSRWISRVRTPGFFFLFAKEDLRCVAAGVVALDVGKTLRVMAKKAGFGPSLGSAAKTGLTSSIEVSIAAAFS